MLGLDQDIDWFHTKTFKKVEEKENSENFSTDLCMHYFDFTDPSLNSLITFPEEVCELKITYDNDLNLIQIHSLIKEKFVRILKKLSLCDTEIYNREMKINYIKIPKVRIIL